MRIIFNSDVLYAQSFIVKLHQELLDFVIECKERGHEIVIPLTTLLEFERNQRDFVAGEVTKLNNAKNVLSRHGIGVADFEASELVTLPDLMGLLKETGVTCELAKPTMGDYENAHRKACLKEIPHPPKIESDEMRDLVIWKMALRIAGEKGASILLSRDCVHTHHRGDIEARKHGLIRCNNLERARESLSIETPSGKKVRGLIEKVWPEVLQSGLPVVKGADLMSVREPRFHDTERGSTVVSCVVCLQTGDGKALSSMLKMEYTGDRPFVLKFTDIQVDDKPWNKVVSLDLEHPSFTDSDLSERKRDLKNAFGGKPWI